MVVAATSVDAQAPYRGSKPDKSSQPIGKAVEVLADLVVTGMDSQKGNVVRVHIFNQGKRCRSFTEHYDSVSLITCKLYGRSCGAFSSSFPSSSSSSSADFRL